MLSIVGRATGELRPDGYPLCFGFILNHKHVFYSRPFITKQPPSPERIPNLRTLPVRLPLSLTLVCPFQYQR